MHEGKHYVVTGASSGIGAAFAEQARALGARITALDIAEPGITVDTFHRTDMSSKESIEAAAGRIGGLDALVNCAGVPEGDLPDEQVFAVNFLGLRHLTDLLRPRVADGGSVLNIASIAGHRFHENIGLHTDLLRTEDFDEGAAWYASGRARGIGAYRFSKEAVWMFTFHGAATGLARGVRMNSVCPGLVRTRLLPAFQGAMTPRSIERVREVGGPAEPREIASVMSFLLSPEARLINGHNLVADGGFVASIMTGP
ncbi:NAD(P)-dependent dehydrogenase (short-subunit alcohol dehydrogenase family) [Thermocatellispora tengchongensis]|uniref:NAD(P)-dependent dehydrogenase (Short-subunit alcohol dehydrogenase family) n=1 Tax=Thermocatellispora tengchongensis TaxID=1073253 RepID=A0A840PB34_9ACTN|nr:SDR family oxidoreductase [Thermocatellispora tengchongensis]MBB5136858.1 NAD(P)-dependent dehydrogenase (short-subunit alcohol dehydrogenase family) [Thermocatellispora tengchongensis]